MIEMIAKMDPAMIHCFLFIFVPPDPR
jgi:hypothetical protein